MRGDIDECSGVATIQQFSTGSESTATKSILSTKDAVLHCLFWGGKGAVPFAVLMKRGP